MHMYSSYIWVKVGGRSSLNKKTLQMMESTTRMEQTPLICGTLFIGLRIIQADVVSLYQPRCVLHTPSYSLICSRVKPSTSILWYISLVTIDCEVITTRQYGKGALHSRLCDNKSGKNSSNPSKTKRTLFAKFL